MLTNYHTHTQYCDGKDSPEDMILHAMNLGFKSLGFSGHGYTDFDVRYCTRKEKMDIFIYEIKKLKKKYEQDIQIYLGAEEDMYAPVERSNYDYIIGSSHYSNFGDIYYPIDSNYDYFNQSLSLYGNNHLGFAETYFSKFCDYINTRKPDIVGHFDLITKFAERLEPFFFEDERYIELSKKYMKEAMKSGCIFEINTGAMARGFRSTPYPHEELLHVLYKGGGKITLCSDCHDKMMLDWGFEEARELLRDIGFKKKYILYNNEFVEDDI